MQCWACNRVNVAQATYCVFCGAGLTDQSALAGRSACVACGQDTRWDWRLRVGVPVCPRCHSGALGRRVAAWFIDRVLLVPAAFVVLAVLADAVDAWAGYSSALDIIAVCLLFGGTLSVLLTRDAWFGGRSPGKLIAGLRVVQADTCRPAGLKASVVRNLFFLVPGASLIAAVRLLSGTGRHPGDEWAGTAVVSARVKQGLPARLTAGQPRFCIQCGRQSPTGAAYCAFCGTRLLGASGSAARLRPATADAGSAGAGSR
jgi:uncharacterized RDD family membrane protein YckC